MPFIDTHTSLEEVSLSALQEQMVAGQLTALNISEYFLRRIQAIDQSGPTLRSVIEVNPEARAIAENLDQERRAGKVRGPLHGIAILLKDNIDTADSMLTTAGSLALIESRPEQDAFIVNRIRHAGAVIIGKTNLSEWANSRGSGSSSGWSARGGQTKNPYVLDRSPSGSSSGSAVAVAAGLVSVAVGTETNGSIVSPASSNGIVGLKPTLGLISRSGIVPLAMSMDTAGPMARTVADAAALLNVLAGYDPKDVATEVSKTRATVDYTRALSPESLNGARIGVLRKAAGFHEGVDQVFEGALKAMRKLGAIILDPVEIAPQGNFGYVSLLMRYEFKDGINRYLASREGGGPKSLSELIAFNEVEREREMRYFGQSHFYESQAKGPLTEIAYLDARQRARELAGTEGIDKTLLHNQLDALIAPTLGPAGLTDSVLGDRSIGGGVTFAPAVAGYPHLTVPMGQVHGLPIGLSFVGTQWSESKLIGYAFAFEQATHARFSPSFLNSIQSKNY
jgi:amidase